MSDKPKPTQVKDFTKVDSLETQNKIEKLESNIIQAISEYTSQGDLEKIEALSNLYLKVQENKQHMSLGQRQGEESLLLSKQQRKINFAKQIISICLSLGLVPLGIYTFFKVDQNTGIFIMGAGFSAAGFSGFMNSDFVKSIITKK